MNNAQGGGEWRGGDYEGHYGGTAYADKRLPLLAFNKDIFAVHKETSSSTRDRSRKKLLGSSNFSFMR